MDQPALVEGKEEVVVTEREMKYLRVRTRSLVAGTVGYIGKSTPVAIEGCQRRIMIIGQSRVASHQPPGSRTELTELEIRRP